MVKARSPRRAALKGSAPVHAHEQTSRGPGWGCTGRAGRSRREPCGTGTSQLPHSRSKTFRFNKFFSPRGGQRRVPQPGTGMSISRSITAEENRCGQTSGAAPAPATAHGTRGSASGHDTSALGGDTAHTLPRGKVPVPLSPSPPPQHPPASHSGLSNN